MTAFTLRWAHPDGAMSMPTPAELARDGYRVVGKDWRYASLLMRRDELNINTNGGGEE